MMGVLSKALSIITAVVFLISFPSSILGKEDLPYGVVLLPEKIDTHSIKIIGDDFLPVSMETFRGSTVILNIWATWCPSCIEEMPSLMRLAQKLKHENVIVVYVNQDKGGVAIAKPFYKKLGMSGNDQYFDITGALGRDLGIRGLPTTFIIDTDGYAVAKVEGPLEWDADNVIQFISFINKMNGL